MRYNDKDFSFVDCTSFALIDHHRLDYAFAFDGHFRQYRFKRTVIVLPRESDLFGAASRSPHRITLSALANTFGGIVRPICLAEYRSIMN